MVLFLRGGGDPGSWGAVSKEGSCFCGGLTFWGGSASKGGRLYGCSPHLRGSREVAWSAGALRASVSPLYSGEPHIVSPLSPHFRCRRGGGQPHRGYMEPLNPPPPPSAPQPVGWQWGPPRRRTPNGALHPHPNGAGTAGPGDGRASHLGVLTAHTHPMHTHPHLAPHSPTRTPRASTPSHITHTHTHNRFPHPPPHVRRGPVSHTHTLSVTLSLTHTPSLPLSPSQ